MAVASRGAWEPRSVARFWQSRAVVMRFDLSSRVSWPSAWGVLSRVVVTLWLAVSPACGGETHRTDGMGQDGDAGTAMVDGRAELPDACCLVSDAGGDDAGPPVRDAGVTGADAGDAGAIVEDAGVEPDAGPTCSGDAELCGDTCVDVTMDVRHCGACDNDCSAPANAAATCSAGACGFACDAGFADCNGSAADGCEVATSSDDANCGACGIACGAYQTCTAGACTDLPYGLGPRATSTTCRIGDSFPTTIDATGCYQNVAGRVPAPGLVEYSVNSLLWADGTGKRRFLMIPPGSTIGYTDDGVWNLPVGTILMKEFLLETRRGDPSSTIALETRFLVRRAGGWGAATYRWNAAQTSADRFGGGRGTYAITESDGSTTSYEHWFPSNTECTFCHNGAAGVALGLRTIQMNRDFDYGRVTDNQLRALENAGYFTGVLPGPASSLPSMPNPADTSAPLVERARAYLEGNCAHCHRPGGPTPRSMDLRYMTPFAMTNTCDVPPESETFDITNARIIAPGEPARSVLHARVSRRGFGQMPIIGTLQTDPDGVALLRSWIRSLTACP